MTVPLEPNPFLARMGRLARPLGDLQGRLQKRMPCADLTTLSAGTMAVIPWLCARPKERALTRQVGPFDGAFGGHGIGRRLTVPWPGLPKDEAPGSLRAEGIRGFRKTGMPALGDGILQ
jgi:hypothetical protein